MRCSEIYDRACSGPIVYIRKSPQTSEMYRARCQVHARRASGSCAGPACWLRTWAIVASALSRAASAYLPARCGRCHSTSCPTSCPPDRRIILSLGLIGTMPSISIEVMSVTSPLRSMPVRSRSLVLTQSDAPLREALLAQAQTHQFNMPFQLAHPSHVPETDVPDNAEVCSTPWSTLIVSLHYLHPSSWHAMSSAQPEADR